MGVRIQDIPEQGRPRERLWGKGAEALTERELLGLVLRTGRRGESALDLADALLAEYGSVMALASALPEELAQRAGLGRAKAASLVAAFHLGRLVRDEPAPTRLRSAEDAARVAIRELDGIRRERVIVIICDAQNTVRRIVGITEGALDRASFPVREILNAVLRHDGRAFAVAHNHPTGDPSPSDTDVRATRDLHVAAKTVGLRFLGHVVVTGIAWAKVPS